MNPTHTPSESSGWKRGFWSLIATQFQGAFSDNALKSLVIFIIIGMGLPPEKRDQLVPVVGALFALPFILFSMVGGFLADRFSKRTITIGVKVFEIFVMIFALAALTLGNLPMELGGIFLMGVHSAMFGPSKYGMLPELLSEKRLSWGNGIVELATFLAIILGTMAGGILSDLFGSQQHWSGVLLIGLAVIGLITSLGITRVPAANPGKVFNPNPLSDLVHQMRLAHKDRTLWLAVLGNAYFFFFAALLQFNILIYGKDVLGLDDTHNSYLNAALAIGIGLGSLAAGYLSGGKIEYGLIPLGSLGLTAFGVILWLPGLSFMAFALNLALLGFFGGFYIVPISALLQHRPDKADKGGVLAAANLMSFIGVFIASGVYYLLASVAHLSPSAIFLAGAGLMLLGTIYLLILLPDSFLRLLLWMLTHTFYRIRVVGRDNIPEKGGALFVCNHLSFVDSLFLLASTDRAIRFMISKEFSDKPWIRPFVRILGAIPVSPQLRPRESAQSFAAARAAIEAGEIVCIFAEGQITRIGQLLPFQRGFERIMEGLPAPIVPVCLDGVWGSIFSFEKRRFYFKLPHRIPYPVTVSFGQPMPASSTAIEVRQVVQQLQSESWRLRKGEMRLLHHSFVATARRSPWRAAMADGGSKPLSFGAVLIRTIFLARRLKPRWEGPEMVGVLLPPTVSGALVNFAALLVGKVPVNLNYTLSEEAIASCVRQCGIKTVVSSQAFLDRLKFKVPGEVLLLEEIARQPGRWEMLTALLLAFTMPIRWLEKTLGHNRNGTLDDLATVIFSSGSTGDPKGVMLTHHNIGANVEQLGQVFALDNEDMFLGILPFFHSFGCTGTLWLPAVLGVGVVYHPNPVDGKGIAGLVRDHAVTFMLATPTFLQIYIRAAEAADFGSLRFVMAGAEKMPESLAAAFEEKFGIRPAEAYGCTECSPAVTVNTRDHREAGVRQAGTKRGSIGHPLPGISVRIVDPDTRQALPVGQAGLLLVNGPNVMKGYLGREEATAQALPGGWYVTGDIAMLDEEGFLQITDRLSRFSKIGGEMVPHIKIEEKLQELAGIMERSFAVTGVPDDRKGERLIVLHTLPEPIMKALLEKLPQLDLPNLWIPRAAQFFHLTALPILGTGKIDLRKIRELALEFSAKT